MPDISKTDQVRFDLAFYDGAAPVFFEVADHKVKPEHVMYRDTVIQWRPDGGYNQLP